MGFAKTEAEWAERASRHLKAELKRAGLTYDELAERLKRHGYKDSRKPVLRTNSRAARSRRILPSRARSNRQRRS